MRNTLALHRLLFQLGVDLGAIRGTGLVVPFDWMSWRAAQGDGPCHVETAADAVRYLTTVVRGERFADGTIEGAMVDGTLRTAIDVLGERWRRS